MPTKRFPYQIEPTELYADAQQRRSDVGERDERGQMIADDDPVVVLGPGRHCGHDNGAAH